MRRSGSLWRSTVSKSSKAARRTRFEQRVDDGLDLVNPYLDQNLETALTEQLVPDPCSKGDLAERFLDFLLSSRVSHNSDDGLR